MNTYFLIPIKNVAYDVVSVLVSNSRLKPIYEVDTDEKKVAISFDATWGSTRTSQLLDILDKHKIKTTFLLTNIWVKKYPQIAKEIADAGHEIGLHTVSHSNLTELPIDKIKIELQDNAKLIKEVTGQVK
ncbi:MAG: polysaccharide deacetylase family protein [Clostridia bacterium]|nr:polysaccharide deacetylase family protein [Clostridia bacterium]